MKLSQNVQFTIIIGILIFSLEANIYINTKIRPLKRIVSKRSLSIVRPTPTAKPVATPTPKPIIKTQIPPEDNDPWGIAKQIDEHTWTMKIGKDERMATAQEIFDALNVYRQSYNRGKLEWNQTLADYAKTRTDFFAKNGNTDKHAGFEEYLKDENNYKKLGFRSLGENSSIGFRLLGVHLIEWVYAGDKPHNDNQLNPEWNSVGIGVTSTATDLIFGGEKF